MCGSGHLRGGADLSIRVTDGCRGKRRTLSKHPFCCCALPHKHTYNRPTPTHTHTLTPRSHHRRHEVVVVVVTPRSQSISAQTHADTSISFHPSLSSASQFIFAFRRLYIIPFPIHRGRRRLRDLPVRHVTRCHARLHGSLLPDLSP